MNHSISSILYTKGRKGLKEIFSEIKPLTRDPGCSIYQLDKMYYQQNKYMFETYCLKLTILLLHLTLRFKSKKLIS